MKKAISIILALCLCLACFAGCGTNGDEAVSSGSSLSPDSVITLSGTVTTGGSTSMEKVVGALIEAFTEANPGVSVTYDPTGSGAGITGASEGTLDIGLSSRALKESETGLDAAVVALDGIAVVVNNSNTVSDLSTEQLRKIATGEITNWSEVGGQDAEIVLVGREAGSGTRDGFESILDVKDSCVYRQELNATGAVIAAVSANPNAIGYASLSAVESTVKAITVDGVAPSEETVLDGSYKVQRPFVMVTSQSAQLSDAAKAFIEFSTSPQAAEIILAAGAVSPNK